MPLILSIHVRLPYTSALAETNLASVIQANSQCRVIMVCRLWATVLISVCLCSAEATDSGKSFE